ncbi:hypothetical protein ABT369_21150 [Dactylosporangium sp. NPDC000244]|uniref:hypothetical protein n=1 Tax=Dactylosporangium sp. NPDC000244 TaxID=3154365 RepID=UPI0033273F6C
MSVLLFGANPGLTLHEGERTVAFASAWRVDWSVRGAGTALVVWHDGEVRIATESPDLGRWLAEAFVRHFPEVAGLPWPEPAVTVAPVRLELDHAAGLRAGAGDVELEITGAGQPRAIGVEAFPGNGLRLTNVYIPCESGRLRLGGTEVAATSANAFLADAEVWSGG